MTKRKTVPLTIENHPESYNGFEFITVLKYNQEYYLSIVDNIDNKTIKSYILDLCTVEDVNEELIISVANEWYTHNKDNYPISIEFSKRELSHLTSKIYRSFNLNYISRIIGPVYSFNMKDNIRVKKRKKKPIPEGFEVTPKPNS